MNIVQQIHQLFLSTSLTDQLYSLIQNIIMRASRINPQPTFYLQVNKQGKTNIVQGSRFHRLSENSYRQVHFEGPLKNEQDSNELYIDEYQIDPGQQFQNNDDDVIFRRLGAMYSKNRRPLFINNDIVPTQPKEGIKIVNKVPSYPHLIEQISLLPTVHYSGLFITQDFTKNGKYQVIINNQGRFQVITVDDKIPIDKKTLEPIWGLSYDRPWEIILVKAWAKKLSGYHKVLLSKPFEFIEAFSNSTWKYFNLAKTQKSFLDKYLLSSKIREAKILLKTKDEPTVCKHGLQQNSLSYTICGGDIQPEKSIPSHLIAVNSTFSTSWEGQYGFLDKNCEKFFRQMNPDLHLNRGFIMSGEDAINNFASAHITSLRQKNFVTGYKVLEVAANEKKAQYLEFILPEDGFFDFCIKQFDDNIVTFLNQSSEVKSRFRHVKYMLIRDNAQSKGPLQVSTIRPQGGNSNIYTKNAKQYKQPRFEVYQIEYSKGYNKGDAHFLNLQRGKYILRIKSQTSQHNARYSINWVSSSKIDIVNSKLTDDQKVDLIHDSFVSIMHKSQHYCFEKKQKTQMIGSGEKKPKTEMISYGDKFLQIGYGFVAVKSAFNCPYSILVEVNPGQLKQEGYALKGKYKGLTDPFNVLIEQGQYDSFILKLIREKKKYQWPTAAFKIWKKPHKEIQGELPQSNLIESNLRSNHGEIQLRLTQNSNPGEDNQRGQSSDKKQDMLKSEARVLQSNRQKVDVKNEEEDQQVIL